jgi:predicted nucleic acid-binding Zn ribbon protein
MAEVLPAFRERLAPATLLGDVQARWAAAAGDEVALHAQPVSERGGMVTLRCDSAVWASELSMMSAQLLRTLNEARPPGAPEVLELRFTVAGADPTAAT